MKTKKEAEKMIGVKLEEKEGVFHYGGSLYLRGTQITSLPDNIIVGGSLDLEGTQITSLPDNITVGGSLDLEGTQITSLPDNLIVGGSLYLEGTQITSLPDNLIVGGSLYLEGTQITSLPDNIIVGGSLYLEGTQITSLPDNIIVGGSLDLRGTRITSLPDNLTVGGYLYLEGTQITSLPDNLIVGGSLYLEGTQITSLPDNLTVGGYLDLEGTQITDTIKVIRKSIDFFEWRNKAYIKVDGIFSKVISHKGNVYKISQIGDNKERYLLTDGNRKWSHGDTLKEAKDDLIFKIGDRDKSSYSNLTLDSELSFEESIEAYRVITGACSAGTKMFVQSLSITKDKYTISEIIELTKGNYGHEKFKNFFV